MRRFGVSLLVFVALLVVADRVALSAAQHDVAKRLQADAHLHSAPRVEIHGFPFLTQLFGGDYHDVDIRMTGLDAGGLRIDTLSVHLQGAHVSIGDVLSQDRSRIHVDRATAHLHLTYADIKKLLDRQIGAQAAQFDHSVVTGATVEGGDTVVLQTADVDVPLKLTGLPFGIRLTSAKATQAGVEVAGQANGLVLRT
jgi:hypothetical protein